MLPIQEPQDQRRSTSRVNALKIVGLGGSYIWFAQQLVQVVLLSEQIGSHRVHDETSETLPRSLSVDSSVIILMAGVPLGVGIALVVAGLQTLTKSL